MGKIYNLYALERLQDMEAEEMPYDIWLPYVQLESERFFFKETGEVWHRFEGVTVYMEDDDYPEGDLIENVERVPEGLVCWLGKNGTVPEAGDVFRVLDGNHGVVFEEVISGEEALYGKKYASAVKEGAFARDLLREVEYALKHGLGDTFGNNLLNYVALEEASSMDVVEQEKVAFCARGISFTMFVDEHVAHSPCKLDFFEADGKHIHSYERALVAGDKWYEVRYRAANDEGPTMCVGWGIGSAQDVVRNVQEVLESVLVHASLEKRLADASLRSQSIVHNKADKTFEI